MGKPRHPDGSTRVRAASEGEPAPQFTFDANEFIWSAESAVALADVTTRIPAVDGATRRIAVDLPTAAIRRIVLPPVFVDESGRRRRWTVIAASLAASVCVAYIAVVGASLLHSGSSGSLFADLLPGQVAAPAQPGAVETDVVAASPPRDTSAAPRRSGSEPSLVAGVEPLPTVIPVPTPSAASRAPVTTAPRTTTRAPARSSSTAPPPASTSPAPQPTTDPPDPTTPPPDPTTPSTAPAGIPE